jgi:hypothetical protein
LSLAVNAEKEFSGGKRGHRARQIGRADGHADHRSAADAWIGRPRHAVFGMGTPPSSLPTALQASASPGSRMTTRVGVTLSPRAWGGMAAFADGRPRHQQRPIGPGLASGAALCADPSKATRRNQRIKRMNQAVSPGILLCRSASRCTDWCRTPGLPSASPHHTVSPSARTIDHPSITHLGLNRWPRHPVPWAHGSESLERCRCPGHPVTGGFGVT